MLTATPSGQTAGSSRTVMSWQTSADGSNGNFSVTGRTLSPVNLFSSSSPASTMKTTVEKREYSYTPSTGHQSSEEVITRSYNAADSHKQQAFTYTPSETRTGSMSDHEGVRSPPPPPVRTHGPVSSSPLTSPTPPPRSHSTLPYKVSYDNPDSVFMSGYHSDSDQPLTWLQQQQLKLRAKKEGRDPGYMMSTPSDPSSSPATPRRTEQERLLVKELKSAQTKIMHKRAQSEADAEEVLREYYPVHQRHHSEVAQNGTTSRAINIPFSMSHNRSDVMSPNGSDSSYKTEKSFFVSGLERPPFTTSQTQYTFSVSPPTSQAGFDAADNTYGAIMTHKPPPVPAGRSSAPTSPIIPTRSSSRGVVERSRTTTTTTREWQTQGKPFAKQQIDSSFEDDIIKPSVTIKENAPMQNSYEYNVSSSSAASSSQYQKYHTMPAQRAPLEAMVQEPAVMKKVTSQPNEAGECFINAHHVSYYVHWNR